jgi:hypothetical protein
MSTTVPGSIEERISCRSPLKREQAVHAKAQQTEAPSFMLGADDDEALDTTAVADQDQLGDLSAALAVSGLGARHPSAGFMGSFEIRAPANSLEPSSLRNGGGLASNAVLNSSDGLAQVFGAEPRRNKAASLISPSAGRSQNKSPLGLALSDEPDILDDFDPLDEEALIGITATDADPSFGQGPQRSDRGRDEVAVPFADATLGGRPRGAFQPGAVGYVGSYEDTAMWSNVSLGASPAPIARAPPLVTARGRTGKGKGRR